MQSQVKQLLDEAAAVDECTTLVLSMSDQVASMARNVHIMGDCADATVALVRKWTGNQLAEFRIV
jgi:hypothetical protein